MIFDYIIYEKQDEERNKDSFSDPKSEVSRFINLNN